MTDEQWYEISKYFRTELKSVNVVRETAASVVTVGYYGGSRESRHKKQGNYSEFVKGWDNAHARAMEIIKQKVDRCQRALDSAQSDYDAIKNMSRPVISREKE